MDEILVLKELNKFELKDEKQIRIDNKFDETKDIDLRKLFEFDVNDKSVQWYKESISNKVDFIIYLSKRGIDFYSICHFFNSKYYLNNRLQHFTPIEVLLISTIENILDSKLYSSKKVNPINKSQLTINCRETYCFINIHYNKHLPFDIIINRLIDNKNIKINELYFEEAFIFYTLAGYKIIIPKKKIIEQGFRGRKKYLKEIIENRENQNILFCWKANTNKEINQSLKRSVIANLLLI